MAEIYESSATKLFSRFFALMWDNCMFLGQQIQYLK